MQKERDMQILKVAIIRTLIYQSIFGSVPSLEQLGKLLVSNRTFTVDEIMQVVEDTDEILFRDGYVFLPSDKDLLLRTVQRNMWSLGKIQIAKRYLRILSKIPWVRMIGISGSVAAFNASEDDDIDLFIITATKRLWLARTVDWFLLNLLRVRRNASSSNVNNKLCVNYYLAEDQLGLENRDVFTANEIARLIPIHDKGVYKYFINSNSWVKNHLGNFWRSFQMNNSNLQRLLPRFRFIPIDWVEFVLAKAEKQYMMPKMTTEHVNRHEVRFHPKDARQRVLREYEKRLEIRGLL